MFIPHFWLDELLVRHPRVAGMVVLVLASISLGLAVKTWSDSQALSSQPEQVTLGQAASRLADSHPQVYAEIQDGEWDCASIIHQVVNDYEFTNVLLVSKPDKILAVASMPEHESCSALAALEPQTGILSWYRQDWLAEKLARNEMGLQSYAGWQVLDFRVGASPANLNSGAMTLLVLAFLLLLVYPVYVLANRLRYKGARRREQEPAPEWPGVPRR